MIGVAKQDAGISITGRIKPVDTKDQAKMGCLILKGHKYIIPDNHVFTPDDLFESDKEKRGK